MTGTRLQVRLYRDSFATPWGFRLQGGKDLKQPLVVQRVFCNSPAEGQLQRGDIIDAIGIKRGVDLSHKQAQDSLKHGGGQIELAVTRPPGNVGFVPQNITPVSTRAPQQNFDPIPEQKPQMPQPRPYGHQPKKVTVSKYGGGGPSFGAEYSGPPASMQSQGGNYRPVEQYNMLNKVQGSLDNIILSPRTPEASPSQAPFYQAYDAYPPQYQEPQQPYVSTGERLDRMKELKGEYAAQSAPAYDPVQPPRHQYGYQSTAERLERTEPEDEDNKVPVWERRQAFTGPSSYAHGESRPIKAKRPPPKFRKPTGPVIGTDYSKVGIDYRLERPHSGVWTPQTHSQPPPHHHQRQSSQPDATSYTPSPYEDGMPTVPAWRNTLKQSGVKPWEEDLDFGSRQPAPEVHEAPRHIKTIQIKLKQPTMQPMQPAKVTQKSPGSQKAPTIAGERDWTQSAVFRMVAQDEVGPPQRGGQRAGPPPPAPKPSMQPAMQPSMQPAQFSQHQYQTPYDDEVGVSDF